eukprot:6928138-Prymnesium_polylepis.1
MARRPLAGQQVRMVPHNPLPVRLALRVTHPGVCPALTARGARGPEPSSVGYSPWSGFFSQD